MTPILDEGDSPTWFLSATSCSARMDGRHRGRSGIEDEVTADERWVSGQSRLTQGELEETKNILQRPMPSYGLLDLLAIHIEITTTTQSACDMAALLCKRLCSALSPGT
jgi:hypothetical protein